MNYYVVRINAKTVEDLKYIDFSNVSNGVIKVKSNESSYAIPGRFGFMYEGLSFETFINGSHSVGMVFLSKLLIDKSNKNLVLSNFSSRSIISGTLDVFNPQFTLEGPCSLHISEGDDILMIRFVTREFYDLLQERKTKGVRSSDIEIQVYVNGEFKPYSNKQMEIHGYELINDSYVDRHKFYDRNYIKYEDNYFDKDGFEKETPTYITCNWKDCEL